jgi:cell wall-associated NlpC family hydrolase
MSTWANNQPSPPCPLSRKERGLKKYPLLRGVSKLRFDGVCKMGKTAFFIFSFSFFIIGCKTTKLPKTTENSRPTKSNSAYKKYTAKLGFEVDKSCNLKLLDEVMDWWGTPYKYGGESKSGADCSGFVQMVFLKVYDKKLPRTTKQQYEFCRKVNKNHLKEGDLVFFETGGKGISHVGIFLKDGRFAHASSSKGVIVNGLEEAYYDKAYRGGGRVE